MQTKRNEVDQKLITHTCTCSSSVTIWI